MVSYKECDKFEPPFKQVKNDELNQNQIWGRRMTGIFVASIVLLILAVYSRNKYLVLATLGTMALFAVMIVREPVLVLRMGDYYIGRQMNTNHILDKEELFPEYKEYEKNWKEYRQELDKLLSDTHDGKDIEFTKNTYGNSGIGRDVDEEANRGWRVFHIMLGQKIIEGSQKYFPKLIEQIKKNEKIKNVTISVLDEKTSIPIHTGYYKGIMRFMLALKVPQKREECYLCVNGDKYSWKEGETILWDDNFPHKVFNRTDEQRVVIYMDIERPDLGFDQRMINHMFTNIIYDSSIIKDEIKRTEKRQKI